MGERVQVRDGQRVGYPCGGGSVDSGRAMGAVEAEPLVDILQRRRWQPPLSAEMVADPNEALPADINDMPVSGPVLVTVGVHPGAYIGFGSDAVTHLERHPPSLFVGSDVSAEVAHGPMVWVHRAG